MGMIGFIVVLPLVGAALFDYGGISHIHIYHTG
jgi:hypothetical protein